MSNRFAGMIFGLCLVAGPALAQDEEVSDNRVSQETDWSVFVEEDPTQCWVVSTPRESVATEDGRVVAVRRGDILLFVSYWPEQNRRGEVSFTGGYPFADGSTVTVEIGSDTYELFTEGEMAWAASEADDTEIVAALKAGAEAVLTGTSTRGRQTEDTFSLRGVTAAIDEAEARCTG